MATSPSPPRPPPINVGPIKVNFSRDDGTPAPRRHKTAEAAAPAPASRSTEKKKMRRRSSTGEDMERLEKLRAARLRAESDACKSPRRPSSISTDTIPKEIRDDLDTFRGEWLAGLAAQRSATPGAPNPLSPVQDCETPPPAVRVDADECHAKVLNMPKPAEPIRIARPNTLTRGSAAPAKDPKDAKKRRGSSVVIPDKDDIAEAMGEPAGPIAAAATAASAAVEFINPLSPRANDVAGADVLDIDVDSFLAGVGDAATSAASAVPRMPAPINTARGKRASSPNADKDKDCVVS